MVYNTGERKRSYIKKHHAKATKQNKKIIKTNFNLYLFGTEEVVIDQKVLIKMININYRNIKQIDLNLQ